MTERHPMQPGDLKPCPRWPTKAMIKAGWLAIPSHIADDPNTIACWQAMYDAAPALPPVPDVEALVERLRAGGTRKGYVTGRVITALDIDRAADALHSQAAECAKLREALKEIAKGAGAFNRDPLIHAENTIEDMKEIARQALSQEPTP